MSHFIRQKEKKQTRSCQTGATMSAVIPSHGHAETDFSTDLPLRFKMFSRQLAQSDQKLTMLPHFPPSLKNDTMTPFFFFFH